MLRSIQVFTCEALGQSLGSLYANPLFAVSISSELSFGVSIKNFSRCLQLMEVYATEEVSHFPNKSSWFMCPEIGVGAHISFTTDSLFIPPFHEEVLIKLILCRYICPDFKIAISMSQLEDRVLTSSSTCIIINLPIGLLVSQDSQGLTYSFFLPD